MPRAMPVVLPNDEERGLDNEPEVAMFEWRSVSFADQKADQALVPLRHLVRRLVERDTRAVHYGEVGGQRSVQRNEPVVEHRDDVLR